MRQSEEDREQLGAPPADESYLTDGTTVMSWLNTRDHKRVGVMFLAAVIFFLFLGGIFAMAIRMKLLYPGPFLFDALTYNRLFTLHGVTMIFLFMIPAIPSAFGNFVLPLMIGARDVAFPRLNLASFYVYSSGAILALWAMVHGGADTGWTFYTPYSTTTPTMLLPLLLAIFVLGFSSIMTGMNFIVTVHTLRAPGIGWMRLPLFVWSIYATSIIQVLATPVIGLTMLLVAAERVLGFGIFDPARGGDPVLFQHFFWFYSHPAVYIMVLPAMAVISECVATFSRKNPFGYKAISFKTPFAYICGFLFFLVFGGMTGVALATVALDVHWHDTYFVVAHFHFIMVGAVIMAFLAALHYWFPKMFGRTYHEGWGLVAASLIILGFNATFIPQFLLGNNGMPRRYYQYPEHFQALNVASTAGATLLGFGFIIIFIYLVIALRWGPRCEQNPWRSKGFEWMTDSPPPTHNFDKIPHITQDPHDYRTHAPSGVYADV